MKRLAAVDIGTNTVRLLVADVEGPGHFADVVRDRVITRLGERVDASGRLSGEAMERTLAAVASLVAAAREHRAEGIRVTGTSALRDAVDRDDFIASVREAASVDLEVLAGPEEGRLSLVGATRGLEGGNHVVCDIGGGSTELSTASGVVSMDIGSVRLRERCLPSDPPTSDEVSAAQGLIAAELDQAASLAIGGFETLVGVAGTITTLAACVLGLEVYDPDLVDGAVLTIADVRSWSRRLLEMTTDEIRRIPVVEEGRADVIAAGVLILRGVMERFRFGEVVVSEHDILDGLVVDLAQRLA